MGILEVFARLPKLLFGNQKDLCGFPTLVVRFGTVLESFRGWPWRRTECTLETRPRPVLELLGVISIGGRRSMGVGG